MDQTVTDLNMKLDALATQVVYLTEQAQIAERSRQEHAELIRDLTPMLNQAFQLSVDQLEEVQEYIDLNDVLRFVKRLLRNGRNLEKMLDQLESLIDLMGTVGPLAEDAFGKAVETMESLEQKGYFTFMQSSMRVMDKLVASFPEADLNNLGDSITPIADIVKEFAKPKIIGVSHHLLSQVVQEVGEPVDASYLGLIRQLRDPDVRRGLAVTLRIIQVIGHQANASAK
jgi:uncharacterized protein YjgD (DUF1641 family)